MCCHHHSQLSPSQDATKGFHFWCVCVFSLQLGRNDEQCFWPVFFSRIWWWEWAHECASVRTGLCGWEWAAEGPRKNKTKPTKFRFSKSIFITKNILAAPPPLPVTGRTASSTLVFSNSCRLQPAPASCSPALGHSAVLMAPEAHGAMAALRWAVGHCA